MVDTPETISRRLSSGTSGSGDQPTRHDCENIWHLAAQGYPRDTFGTPPWTRKDNAYRHAEKRADALRYALVAMTAPKIRTLLQAKNPDGDTALDIALKAENEKTQNMMAIDVLRDFHKQYRVPCRTQSQYQTARIDERHTSDLRLSKPLAEGFRDKQPTQARQDLTSSATQKPGAQMRAFIRTIMKP